MEKGDSRIFTKANEDIQSSYPDVYQSILVDRNNDWLPKIEKYFEDKTKEFILVGNMHLYGEHGLLNQLKTKGYSIKQLE